MVMSDLLLDINYIQKVGSRLEQFAVVRKDVWWCRCPICGDSKKKKHKKRFYFYKQDELYKVKCHNCGYSTLFSIFLKEEHSDLYREYLIEKLPKRTNLKENRFKHLKNIVPKKYKCKGFDYSFLCTFESLPPEHPARVYTEKRKIPLNKVLYAPKFCDVIKELNLTQYIHSFQYSTEPRMIIPFYREDGLSTVFQARAFSKKEKLRYITIKEHENEKKIYGLYGVDKSLPVWCTEGPIDSMMIPNAIAMSGISTALPKGISDFRFIFDNEPRNKDVVKNMRKRLRAGHSVVIFPERIEYKDLNDMVVKGEMGKDYIVSILEDNLYSGDKGIMKLNEWSKL